MADDDDDIIKGAQIQLEAVDAKKGMDALAWHQRYNQLAHYRAATPAQAFHDSHAKERLLIAGSQQGKTYAISRELAMHALNRYPQTWTGRRFDTRKPGISENTFLAWVGSVSNATTRAGAQVRLLGEVEVKGSLGTEALPAVSIISVFKGRGISGLCDYVVVRRDPTILKDGTRIDMGTATIRFLSYEMGWQAWQAASVDYCWLDEQPPDHRIYLEAFARTAAVRGVVAVSLTPLGGRDELIARYEDVNENRQTFHMTIKSEGMWHISPEDAAARIADYENDKSMTESEKQTRLYGVPSMAEGAIYTVPLSQILYDQGDMFAEVNKPWMEVWGCVDPNHQGVSDQSSPAAFVILSRDKNDKTVRVVDAWRLHKVPISTQIQAIREHKIGSRIRWHWPRDTKSGAGGEDGLSIKEKFRKGGIYMAGQHARTAPPGNDIRTETGIGLVRELLLDRKLFISRHLESTLGLEYQNYRYVKGKATHSFCDLLDALRHGVMDTRGNMPTLREYDDMRYGGPTDGRRRNGQIVDGADPDPWGYPPR